MGSVDRLGKRLAFGAAITTLGGAVLLGGALLAARSALARQGAADAIRAFNRRILNPRALRIAGQPGRSWNLLLHTGRRSGRAYTTPLMAFPTPGGFVIPMTYGPRADWVKNTLAADGATLVYHGESIPLTHPRVVPLATVLHTIPLAPRLTLRLLGVTHALLADQA